MFRLLALFCLLFVVAGLAQSSVGFREPADKQPLTAYRLPEWGYNVFSLSLASNGAGNKSDSDDLAGYSFSSRGSGYYHYFQESEAERLQFTGQGEASHSLRMSNYLVTSSTMDNNRAINTRLSLDFINDHYFKNGHHFSLAANVFSNNSNIQNYLLPEHKDDSRWKKGTKERRGDWGDNITVAYGLGRIRNVTPVIRALRFRERFATLGLAQNLTSEQVQETAGLFAQYSGYGQVYDRMDKYFWDKIFAIAHTDSLTPLQIYYLRDVLDENLENRYEGRQIDLSYSMNTSHVNQSPGASLKQVTHKIGITGQWYKNLNLNHQLSFTIEPGYEIFMVDTRDVFQFDVNSALQHLWIIADRLTLTSSAAISFNQHRITGAALPDGSTGTQGEHWSTNSSSHLTLFIEDHLSLTTTAEVRTSGWELYWQLAFNFNYYVDRSMR